MISESETNLINFSKSNSNIELLYNNVWGTIYNATESQCDASPFHTADGSFIKAKIASKLRWIAISQEMINCSYRDRISGNKHLFKGKIKFGDTVWIDSQYPEINGFWVVHDAKNSMFRKSIDFLQTQGDKSLYKNYPSWSGKFTGIKIYRILNSKDSVNNLL
jgi:hypothetical protein